MHFKWSFFQSRYSAVLSHKEITLFLTIYILNSSLELRRQATNKLYEIVKRQQKR